MGSEVGQAWQELLPAQHERQYAGTGGMFEMTHGRGDGRDISSLYAARLDMDRANRGLIAPKNQ